LFLTPTDVVVKGALNGLAVRHRVYLNNIANIETPGFQPSEVPFEAELRSMRGRLAEQPAAIERMSLPSLEVIPGEGVPGRMDGNGVQADRQLLRLTENTMTYEALIQAARMRGEILKSVLKES